MLSLFIAFPTINACFLPVRNERMCLTTLQYGTLQYGISIVYPVIHRVQYKCNMCNYVTIFDYLFHKVINKSKVMHHVPTAIDNKMVDVRVAAMRLDLLVCLYRNLFAFCRCLLSLSRSPKLLRTYLSDTEVWKAVVRVNLL